MDIFKSCWIWTKTKNKEGYGIVRIDGKTMNAHRYVYTIFYGPIPEGFDIHHTCKNPSCYNPKHLKALSKKAHKRRHKKKPRQRT